MRRTANDCKETIRDKGLMVAHPVLFISLETICDKGLMVIHRVLFLSPETIGDKVLKRIDKLCMDHEFDPDLVAQTSIAAKCLCM